MKTKLLKYELSAFFNNIKKVGLIALIAYLFSIILRFLNIKFGDRALGLQLVTSIFDNLINLFLVVLLIGVIPIMFYVRYYQTMYGKYSYLTHSLPIRGSTIYSIKLLSAMVIQILSFLILLCLFALKFFLLRDNLSIFISNQILVFCQTPHFWYLLLLFLWSIISFALLITFCLNRGSESDLRRFGIGGAIIVYIIVSVIMQIMYILAMFFFPLSIEINTLSEGSSTYNIVFQSMLTPNNLIADFQQIDQTDNVIIGLGGPLILMLLFNIYYYFRSRKSVEKKLILK